MQGSLTNYSLCASFADGVLNYYPDMVGRAISRNLKLGGGVGWGIDKCLGGGGVSTCAKRIFAIKNINKHKTLRGVVICRRGGGV